MVEVGVESDQGAIERKVRPDEGSADAAIGTVQRRQK
jgi:hypothetical protein